MADNMTRCFGNGVGKEFYAAYHDEEWGVPVHDDRTLFEMLILEGAQAGLSWETVLRKREGYRAAFYHFDVGKVAQMTDAELEAQRLCRKLDPKSVFVPDLVGPPVTDEPPKKRRRRRGK